MSHNHQWQKPPHPQKYRHAPVQRHSHGEPRSRGSYGPLVFFIAFLGLVALALASTFA